MYVDAIHKYHSSDFYEQVSAPFWECDMVHVGDRVDALTDLEIKHG